MKKYLPSELVVVPKELAHKYLTSKTLEQISMPLEPMLKDAFLEGSVSGSAINKIILLSTPIEWKPKP